jgi:hypothetical protein
MSTLTTFNQLDETLSSGRSHYLQSRPSVRSLLKLHKRKVESEMMSGPA